MDLIGLIGSSEWKIEAARTAGLCSTQHSRHIANYTPTNLDRPVLLHYTVTCLLCFSACSLLAPLRVLLPAFGVCFEAAEQTLEFMYSLVAAATVFSTSNSDRAHK